MAKVKDQDQDEDEDQEQNDKPAALSEDTLLVLNSQVKKGKPRRFFLILKGSAIQTLVVFKKGPFGPKIVRAKKDGFKGQVAYGIVTGSGKNLDFQLPATAEAASAMNIDVWAVDPPTKKGKLRMFLSKNGYPCKPIFTMVRDAEAI